ncbi:MAG: heme-binding protein [Phycisphaerales bacterium]|nr:heme-binding protein [Phycisphaerales bacterium]
MILKLIAIALALGGIPMLSGCLQNSGGVWLFNEAPRPVGWPALTPVGEVRVREYPAYRAAEVTEQAPARSGTGALFNELFGHINRNKIAMTAPVEMGYTHSESDRPRVSRMAFVYRDRSVGGTGADGPVRVDDLPPATFASVGVRGDYTPAHFKHGLGLVRGFLAAHPEWRAVGEPRYLGYNGPLVPWLFRYGEVQVPVVPGAG